MPRPYFTARHLESMALLPDKLELGRVYFIDDEQIIVIDHGRGPVIYGKSPGPQGIPGEPIPQLQDQIDQLAAASLTVQHTLWAINEREIAEAKHTDSEISRLTQLHNSDIASVSQRVADNLTHTDSEIASVSQRVADNLTHTDSEIASVSQRVTDNLTHTDSEIARVSKVIADNLKHSDKALENLTNTVTENLEHTDSKIEAAYELAKELSGHNALAIASIIETLHQQFNKYDSAIQILAKSISELYPEHYAPEVDPYLDPLDNEVVATDAGAWTIQQTTLKDGTVILSLSPVEPQVIDTLKAGDSVDFDGGYWTVDSITTEDGITSITLKP